MAVVVWPQWRSHRVCRVCPGIPCSGAMRPCTISIVKKKRLIDLQNWSARACVRPRLLVRKKKSKTDRLQLLDPIQINLIKIPTRSRLATTPQRRRRRPPRCITSGPEPRSTGGDETRSDLSRAPDRNCVTLGRRHAGTPLAARRNDSGFRRPLL